MQSLLLEAELRVCFELKSTSFASDFHKDERKNKTGGERDGKVEIKDSHPQGLIAAEYLRFLRC